MSTKKIIIGYIVSYILSEILVLFSVISHCLRDGWHRFIDFAWWQIGIPVLAIVLYIAILFVGYFIIGKRY